MLTPLHIKLRMRDSHASDARNIPPYATPIPRPLLSLAAPQDPANTHLSLEKSGESWSQEILSCWQIVRTGSWQILLNTALCTTEAFINRSVMDMSVIWGSGKCRSRSCGSVSRSTGSTQHVKCNLFFHLNHISAFSSVQEVLYIIPQCRVCSLWERLACLGSVRYVCSSDFV